MFIARRNTDKFCSTDCYNDYRARKSKVSEVMGFNWRKSMATNSSGHMDDLKSMMRQFSTFPPHEMLAAVIDKKRQVSKTRAEIRLILKSASPQERKAALRDIREFNETNKPQPKLRGVIHWCRDCGSVKVNKSWQRCSKCSETERTRTAEIDEPGSEYHRHKEGGKGF